MRFLYALISFLFSHVAHAFFSLHEQHGWLKMELAANGSIRANLINFLHNVVKLCEENIMK
jgi:hypothetical protein